MLGSLPSSGKTQSNNLHTPVTYDKCQKVGARETAVPRIWGGQSGTASQRKRHLSGDRKEEFHSLGFQKFLMNKHQGLLLPPLPF